MIGGRSPQVSNPFYNLPSKANCISPALKVHHAGFFEDQREYLNADTGVPGMKSDIEMSDMAANGFGANGAVNGDHSTLPADA